MREGGSTTVATTIGFDRADRSFGSRLLYRAMPAPVPVRPVLGPVWASGAEEEATIVRDEATFAAIWEETFPGSSGPPPVDFESDMVVAVFLGMRPDGSFSFRFEAIEDEGTRLLVRFQEVEARGGESERPRWFRPTACFGCPATTDRWSSRRSCGWFANGGRTCPYGG
jgi:hypothetical protein